MENTISNILITGASSGIGEALAYYYAAHGAQNLFICGRNAERLEAVKNKCEKISAQTKVYAKIISVTQKAEMQNWIVECNRIAPLNLVFANAGVSTGEETPQNIYATFETNIMGTLNTITPACDIFKSSAQKTKIIAITASIAGYHGLVACPSYSASKACLKAYGEALRGSLKPYNIQVNTICPGFVKSRITDKNTCPMPFLMPADKAAEIIARKIAGNIGLIAFPWPMRFAAWFMSVLPNAVSSFIYEKLPHKV